MPMTYHVLARKWRPQTFADLVGQSHVVKALSFALSQNQVHHAYLFTGTRGVGKTSIARIFAKSLNCETNGVSANPCGECESCREIKAGKFVDLIEVDAASRTGVEETRELIESVSYRPTKGRYKVYLIDEVHMFSKSSFNALLKTLEEPPAYVKFILATTDPEKLPITILSRCLQFNLKSLTQAQTRQHLINICQAESISYDTEALSLLANAGDGSMRDTLSMTDQAIAYGQGNLNLAAVTEILGTIQPADIESILFAIATNNPTQLSNALHRLDDYEIDARAFLIELMKRLQRMAWAKEGIVESLSPNLLSTVTDIPKPLIHLWYDIAEKALPNLALSGDPRKAVEMTLLRMIAFIPDDWVARHRTAFETPQATDNNTQTSIAANTNTDIARSEHATKQTTVTEKKTENTTTATPTTETPKDTPPWENEPVEPNKQINTQSNRTTVSGQNTYQTETPLQHADFAEQVHAKPVTEQDSLEAAEASFSHETSTPSTASVSTIANTVTEPPVVANPDTLPNTPIAANNELPHHNTVPNNQAQDSWHLNSEASQEPPPSMADIHHMMQRGSDLTTSVNITNNDITTDNANPIDTDIPNALADEPILATEIAAKTTQQLTQGAASNENDTAAKIAQFNWFELVHQLALSDYTLHFVSLGILRLVDDENRLQAILDLSPKHEVLSTEESLLEMQSALQKHFLIPITFTVNLTDVYEQTPAEQKQQKLQQDRTSIVEQFTNNTMTQRIVNELGGEIIDKTIRATKPSL